MCSKKVSCGNRAGVPQNMEDRKRGPILRIRIPSNGATGEDEIGERLNKRGVVCYKVEIKALRKWTEG